jgi:isopenicillin-N epimerase
MTRNRELAHRARRLLLARTGADAPCPEDMVAAMASIPIGGLPNEAYSPHQEDPLQATLAARHGIEVPVVRWPRPRGRWLRISAQLYNTLGDYARLAGALDAEQVHGPGG